MGVLFDIYCIPEQPFSLEWSTILHKLLGDGLVRPPFWVGHPLRTGATSSFLRSPELAFLEAQVGGEPETPRELATVDEALAQVGREGSAMLAVEAPASSLRSEPQSFHPMPSFLGLYRFPAGHTLIVGEPADPAWEFGNREPTWRGEVFELLWINGKNAPLREDFEGSRLHLAIEALWPRCTILADERL